MNLSVKMFPESYLGGKMRVFSNDEVLEKATNKYILSKVIAKRARELKQEEDIDIGYQAINSAVEELMNDEFTYVVRPKKRVE